MDPPQTRSDTALSSVYPHPLALCPPCCRSSALCCPHPPPPVSDLHTQPREAGCPRVILMPTQVGNPREKGCLSQLGLLFQNTAAWVGYTTDVYFSQFWRLQVRDQRAGWLVLGGGPLPGYVLTWAFLVTAETPCLPFTRALILSGRPHPHDLI